MRHQFGKPLTDDEVIQIGELYRSGYGTTSISKQINRPYDTVRNVLRGRCRKYRRLLGGRLMTGKRPAQELAIYAKSM